VYGVQQHLVTQAVTVLKSSSTVRHTYSALVAVVVITLTAQRLQTAAHQTAVVVVKAAQLATLTAAMLEQTQAQAVAAVWVQAAAHQVLAATARQVRYSFVGQQVPSKQSTLHQQYSLQQVLQASSTY
jgi:hypothetical protein